LVDGRENRRVWVFDGETRARGGNSIEFHHESTLIQNIFENTKNQDFYYESLLNYQYPSSLFEAFITSKAFVKFLKIEQSSAVQDFVRLTCEIVFYSIVFVFPTPIRSTIHHI